MIALAPIHLQIAGIVVVLAMGAGFLFWSIRAILGMHRGHPVYMLPDPDPDRDDVDDGDGDTTDT